MKKNLKNALCASIFFTSILHGAQSLAKTQGNYLGASIIRSESENSYTAGSGADGNLAKFKEFSNGYGFDYKYAINFNRAYLAPGVFYDRLGNKAQDQTGDSVEIEARYGIKADLGYDVTDNMALYVTGGWANNKYKVKFAQSGKTSNEKDDLLYGFGVNFYPHKDIAVNFEYNIQELENLETPSSVTTFDNRIDVIKLGAAYHF